MSARRVLTIGVSVLLALADGSGSGQESQTTWRPPVELRPMLTLRVSSTGLRAYGSGIPGGIAVARGDYQGFVLTPGFPEAGLCLNSLQVGVARSNLENGLVSWLVESRLVEIDRDEATIDLRWTRRVNEPGLIPSEPFTAEQRLTLRNGSHGVLDLVRGSAPASDGCNSLALEFEFQLEGVQALEDAALGYDVWLVQRDTAAASLEAHYTISARQNQDAEYFFAPIEYRNDGSRATGHADVRMTVSGRVRGRVRPDGDIDLTIEAGRGYVSLDRDGSGHASSWNHGRTLITVRPGETVETVIDPPSENVSLAGVGSLAERFGTHRTAIRITARRLW
jgi:hypothetical protein